MAAPARASAAAPARRAAPLLRGRRARLGRQARRRCARAAAEKPYAHAPPQSASAQASLAASACAAARAAGVRRQSVTLRLPPVFKTDLDDWPGGIRQQYQVLAKCPLPDDETFVTTVLRGASGSAGSGSLKLQEETVDKGDAVVRYDGEGVVGLSFPTADAIRELKSAAAQCDADEGKCCVILNPQWTAQGSQVISDFGIGPFARRNYDYIDTFVPTFVCKQIRMEQRDVLVLRAFPAGFDAFALGEAGEGFTHLGSFGDAEPDYAALKDALSAAFGEKSLLQRLASEVKWNADNLQ